MRFILAFLTASIFNVQHPAPQGQHYCYRIDRGNVVMERLHGPGPLKPCGVGDLPCVMVHHDGEHEKATPAPKDHWLNMNGGAMYNAKRGYGVWSYPNGEIIGYSTAEDSIIWNRIGCQPIYE